MAVALAQARADGAGTGTVASATLGSTPTPGNIVVFTVGLAQIFGNISAMSPVGNWTTLNQSNAAVAGSMSLFARVVQAGETGTYSVTALSALWDVHVYEISGADVSVAAAIPAANHASGSNTTTTTTSQQVSSLTPTSGLSAYAIASIFWNTGTTSAQSVNSSYTIHVGSTNRGAVADISLSPTTGSYAPTFSWTTGRAEAFGHVIVQEAAAATPLIRPLNISQAVNRAGTY